MHRIPGTAWYGVVFMLAFLLLTGCAGRVTPPVVLHEPVDVYLVDHGRHSSLVLPRGQGLVRYAYGEWGWYVMGRRGTLAGMSAMLWPTRGALGRRIFPDLAISPFPTWVAPEGVEEVFSLQAEAARVEQLQRELDRAFDAGSDQVHYHEGYDLEFVPYHRPYWLGHQSNLVTAQWLESLGFEVAGIPWLSNWHIETPTEDPEPVGTSLSRPR
ncbi:hypothetical protein GCM10007160_00540 [Litchfieldella qijiaojingensis]|uniref:DUF2459 domain-containing protein n=1 Tax=Litchfieldella qijiaojingensis TaxID=980347 RepID=A0ABQ2YBR3_9GAMM|nr:hypothetical protein [Halomonas qijiaojingensis]GGX77241.1 hypothetical protein GCM10007160_00540 [Halomonas qijiaojingensis]